LASSFNRPAIALGLCLLLFEAAITLVGAVHPRVDEYYRDYYITRSRTCWLQPAQIQHAETVLAAPVSRIAALDKTTACFLLESGWSAREKMGVWSLGHRAVIELPAVPGKKLILTVTGYARRNNQMVTVYVNGEKTGSAFIPTGPQTTLAIRVPPSAAGKLVIAFRIKHPGAPNAIDSRDLGLALIAIRWLPATSPSAHPAPAHGQ
jgi:hypothetical protein